MPYKSKAERAWMHVHKPAIAARWDREGGTPKNLPARVGGRQKIEKHRRRK